VDPQQIVAHVGRGPGRRRARVTHAVFLHHQTQLTRPVRQQAGEQAEDWRVATAEDQVGAAPSAGGGGGGRLKITLELPVSTTDTKPANTFATAALAAAARVAITLLPAARAFALNSTCATRS